MSRRHHGRRILSLVPGMSRRRDRVAFVLSGGGVLGAIQVGQLEALVAHAIVPDLVVGTSVGALNAAAFTADPTVAGAERLRSAWMQLRTDDVFPGGRVQRAWQLLRRGDHVYSSEGLRRLVAMVPTQTFEDMRIPLHVSATNLRTGKQQWFSGGPIEAPILASAALPGLFPPVQIEGEMYVDGGVVDNVPIARAVELGATKIYVLSCTGPEQSDRPIRRPLDVLVQAFTHSRAARVEIEVQRFGRQATIEVLPAVDPGPLRMTDLSQTERIATRARELAELYLAQPLAAAARA